MRFRIWLVVLTVLGALTSCSRDPNVVKKKYVESGNRYFQSGKYKEASIMYRNALQKDQKYGEAYYRLALTELKQQRPQNAVGFLVRALDTLPAQGADTEKTDAKTKLAEIYVRYCQGHLSTQPQPDFAQIGDLLKKVEATAREFLQKDPKSSDGHRLLAEWHAANAWVNLRRSLPAGQKSEYAEAAKEFQAALETKPEDTDLKYRVAQSLLLSDQFAEAERAYKATIERDKSYLPAYSDLYSFLRYQKRVPESEALVRQAMAADPQKLYPLALRLAQDHFNNGREADMRSVLDDLKSKVKGDSQFYVQLGTLFARMRNYEEAVRQFQEGARLHPKQKADFQRYIIQTYMSQGKKVEAAQLNDEILKENPGDAGAKNLKAELALDRGEIDQAWGELQAIVNANPNNAVYRYNLGRASMLKGDLEGARREFEQAIRIDPRLSRAQLGLAQLGIARRDYSEAIAKADVALSFEPRNSGARLVRTAGLVGLGRRDEARKELEAILASEPDSPDALFQMGVINNIEKKYKEAEAAYRRCHALSPTNARCLMGVVENYMNQSQPDAALRTIQEELQKTPDRLELISAMGNVYVRSGKVDLGISEFQKLAARLNKNPVAQSNVYLRIGESYKIKRDLDNARENFRKARDLNPKDPVATLSLALVLDGQGKREEAKKVYEDALRLQPDNVVILNNLAFLIAESGGDLDQALTLAQRAKQKAPDLAEVTDTMGWIYLKKNLSDNAIQLFQQLTEKYPNYPTFRYHFGMALHQKGDKIKAAEQLNLALKSKPSKEEETKIKELLSRMG